MKRGFLLQIFFLVIHYCLQAKNDSIPGSFSTLDNGTRYMIHTSSGGESPVTGDMIRMSLKKFLPDNTLQFSTEMLDAPDGIEMTLQNNYWPGDILDVFLRMKKGDKATAYVPVWIADKDSSRKDDQQWYRYEIILHDFMRKEAYEQKRIDRLKELETIEGHLFDSLSSKYPAANLLNTQQGIHIILIQRTADTHHPFLQEGQDVTVHYKLKLLPQMNLLDNSYDRGEPFTFTLGKGEVIKGWDLALPSLKKGDKAILLIPSWLAYGERGAGHDIQPDTPLWFEIEIL